MRMKGMRGTWDDDSRQKFRRARTLWRVAPCVETAEVWSEIEIPTELGADVGTYKWRQNQTFVEVFIMLPPHCAGAQHVDVKLTAETLEIRVCGEVLLAGELYAPIKAEASTWIISDGVLEVSMLKRNRRGNYANGSSNADTFWFGVIKATDDGAKAGAKMLELEHPPEAYYHCEWVREPEGSCPDNNARGSKSGKRVQRKG